MGEFCVYHLIDPRNGMPFYVGCTKSPVNREKAHRAGSKTCCSRVRVLELKSVGLRPIFKILKSGMNKLEARWMEREEIYETKGLLNKIDRGCLSVLLMPRAYGSADAAYNAFVSKFGIETANVFYGGTW